MFGDKKKLEEQISSTIYDLTHLEINTIIKDEMIASKAPASARLILHDLSKKYHLKLVSLGEKYQEALKPFVREGENLFRGEKVYTGSGKKSFLELRERARFSNKLLQERKAEARAFYMEDQIEADIKMLQRIESISNDIMNILVIEGVDPVTDLDFDVHKSMVRFRTMPSREADRYELNLDLRQFLVIKKANDIGTEKVVLQTIIGIDGDITTRISKAFAEQPIVFINNMHHDAIGISVKFWENLVNVVVKLGESLIGLFTNKAPKT